MKPNFPIHHRVAKQEVSLLTSRMDVGLRSAEFDVAIFGHLKSTVIFLVFLIFVVCNANPAISNGQDFYVKGVSEARSGNHFSAVESFTKALDDTERNGAPQSIAPILIYRADSLRMLGRFDEMLTDADKAILMGYDKPVAYYLRGTAFANIGENEQAIFDFSKTLELKESYYPAYAQRGVVYIREKKFEMAYADFKRALEYSPKDITANYNIAALYIERKEFQRAISHLEIVIDASPEEADAYLLRARARNEIGLKKAALRDLEKYHLLNKNGAQ